MHFMMGSSKIDIHLSVLYNQQFNATVASLFKAGHMSYEYWRGKSTCQVQIFFSLLVLRACGERNLSCVMAQLCMSSFKLSAHFFPLTVDLIGCSAGLHHKTTVPRVRVKTASNRDPHQPGGAFTAPACPQTLLQVSAETIRAISFSSWCSDRDYRPGRNITDQFNCFQRGRNPFFFYLSFVSPSAIYISSHLLLHTDNQQFFKSGSLLSFHLRCFTSCTLVLLNLVHFVRESLHGILICSHILHFILLLLFIIEHELPPSYTQQVF